MQWEQLEVRYKKRIAELEAALACAKVGLQMVASESAVLFTIHVRHGQPDATSPCTPQKFAQSILADVARIESDQSQRRP